MDEYLIGGNTMDIFDILSRAVGKYAGFQYNPISKYNKKEYGVRNHNLYLFLDTNIWINLAEKGCFEELASIYDIHRQFDCMLISPDQLFIEWDRNKEKVAKKEQNTLNEIIKKTRNFKETILQDKEEKEVLDKLITDAESFKDKQVEKITHEILGLFDQIIRMGIHIKMSDKDKIEAAEMALEKKAPFGTKNSMGDAILFFSLVNYLENEYSTSKFTPTLYFVSENKSDFSETSNSKEMDKDLLEKANSKKVNIKYYLSVQEALEDIYTAISDEEYIEEYIEEYNKRTLKCKNCGHDVKIELQPFDGYGNKISYKCSNEHCDYIKHTNEYNQDHIVDMYN